MLDIEKLDKLIARLNSTGLVDPAYAKTRYRAHVEKATSKMLRSGQSFGVESGGLAILNQSESKFKADIKAKNDDLAAQIDIFNEALDLWFEHGEPHPPYYPWRIAVILSKAKRKDKEEAFLRAYSRHFKNRRGGARDEKINARADKFGI